jgi:hypothetical protein
VDVGNLDVSAGVRTPADGTMDAPEFAGTKVAEHRGLAASKHGRHPPASIAQGSVPDCINTTMKGVESVGPDAAAGARLRDAGLAELSDRDHPVLTSGKTGNEGVRIRFGALVPHVRN